MVGLGNVNNTSDLNKPISTATQTALNLIATQTAPLNSPALTGNPTAPTQASTDNSTSIATTAYVQSNLTNYATKTSLNNYVQLSGSQTITGAKTFTYGLTTTYSNGNGSIKVLPNTTSTSDSSIGFFRNYNMSVSNPGDLWIAGQNIYGVGAGNFAIGCNSLNAAVTISSTGSITVGGS